MDFVGAGPRYPGGRRRVSYFVHDPRTALFEPGKFSACVRLSLEADAAQLQARSLTGMGIASYSEIDHQHPLFDCRRAWQHLKSNLNMTAAPLARLAGSVIEAFESQTGQFTDELIVDSNGAVIQSSPDWMF